MMDEFLRLKPGETVANVLRYNSDAVVLCDLGSDFNFVAGETKRVSFAVSNFADAAPDAKLSLSLVGEDNAVVWTGVQPVGDVRMGEVAPLGAFDVAIPSSAEPRRYFLRVAFSGGRVTAENEWEVYAFPEAAAPEAAPGLKVVEDITADDLVAAMGRGERVLLFGAGPFESLPPSYRIGLAGRCSGNYATIVKPGHPALAGMPHEGFCGWQFRRLMEGGRAVQLEAGVPFDPIVDVASSDKFVIRQSSLFEYRVGEGRLLVCSFRFNPRDPAARWLRRALVAYAASDAFAPRLSLAPAQLRAVIDAPRVVASVNTNRARNPNDPSSLVRAGDNAQP